MRCGRNHLARHSERGTKTRQRKKRWEDNVREWRGLVFAKSQKAVENREKWRNLVVKSSVVPQRPSCLRNRWDENVAKVPDRLHPTFSETVSSGIFRTALLVAAALVEWGVNNYGQNDACFRKSHLCLSTYCATWHCLVRSSSADEKSGLRTSAGFLFFSHTI